MPAHIANQFVVLDAAQNAHPENPDAELYARLDQNYAQFKNCALISSHTFSEDWTSWEMHPEGDEIVLLLSGATEFVLQLPEGEKYLPLNQTGQFAIVPKGVWHTARTSETATVLFITPGEGTRHKSV